MKCPYSPPNVTIRKDRYEGLDLTVTYNGGLDPLVANDFNFI